MVRRFSPVLLAALGGVAAGWLLRGGTEGSVAEQVGAQEMRMKRAERRDDDAGRRKAARWLEQMDGDPYSQEGRKKIMAAAVAVPPEEYAAVLAGFMDSVWGGISDQQMALFEMMMNEWMKKDEKGALAWARGLRNPQQREAGLCGAAAALAEAGRYEEAFAIYRELDVVTMRVGGSNLNVAAEKAYSAAAAAGGAGGAAAMLELIQGSPDNKANAVYMVNVEYPQGFDFAALLDGMSKTGLTGKWDLPKPFFQPASPLARWAERDADAAFRYVAGNLEGDTRHDLQGMAMAMEKTRGRQETIGWLMGKMDELEPGQRQRLLGYSGILFNDGYLQGFAGTLATREAAANFHYDVAQAEVDTNIGGDFRFLGQMPEVDDRLAVLERVRGLKYTENLRQALVNWKVPEEQIKTVLKTVTKKKGE